MGTFRRKKTTPNEEKERAGKGEGIQIRGERMSSTAGQRTIIMGKVASRKTRWGEMHHVLDAVAPTFDTELESVRHQLAKRMEQAKST